MTHLLIDWESLEELDCYLPSIHETEDEYRAGIIRGMVESARVLFGPIFKGPDKVTHGGYCLYSTDTPGLFICKGPLESIPGTRGREKGNACYSVHAFVQAGETEWRDESCREYCECKACEIWGICKHLIAVKIQIAKAAQIVHCATPPVYAPPIGSRRSDSNTYR